MKINLIALMVISVIMISIGDAYAGSPEYDNRASLFWLQFYITAAVIIGAVIISAVLLYRFKKYGGFTQRKTKDMRKDTRE